MNRDVKLLAEACASHESPGVRAAAKRILAPKRRPSLPRHSAVAKASERKQAKKDERRAKVAAIREAVFARADGRCEAASPMLLGGALVFLRCNGTPKAMDHWLGGTGRRRAEESVETCWALCSFHDWTRTRNEPSAEAWNEIHRWHCETHGYRFTPHYDARAAARRSRAEGDGR